MINNGVSFGFLPGLPPWHLFLVLVALIIYAVKMRELFERVGVGLIILGGGGNLFSRVLYGGVVDNWSFFGLFYNNVWDWLIAIGVSMYIFSIWKNRVK